MPTESPSLSLFRTEIAGVPISDLVERFGTPTYVYDESTILERIEDLRSFDVIRYAQKACSNLAILDLMRRQWRAGRRRQCRRNPPRLGSRIRSGGQPPGIVYTADIFDHDALRLVIEHDIHVNFGSPDMIDQLRRGGSGPKHHAAD